MLVEGVGAMGVAGTLEVMEDVEGLGELLDGTFGCPAQSIGIAIDVVEMVVMAVEIMMASISFVM